MTTITAPATADLDVRTDRRLLTVGVAALAAAALGSVLGASPAMTDTPSTDTHCRVDIVGSYWFSSGCNDESASPAAR